MGALTAAGDGEKRIRSMTVQDIPEVVAIIDGHDDDDAEEAEHSFKTIGTDFFNVLEYNGRIVGVTGIRPIEGADHSAWLSWTYVDDNYCGKGLGRWMLEQLLDQLREHGGRMLFVAVSDYIDPEDGPIYAAALKLYKSLGFVQEIHNTDFYDKGEAQHLLTLRLKDCSTAAPEPDEHPGLTLCKLDEIAETDGSYFIGWKVEGKKVFTANDLEIGINAARENSGRNVYITFPSNLPDVVSPLLEAGFSQAGKLSDYYSDGVDEVHYVYRIFG